MKGSFPINTQSDSPHWELEIDQPLNEKPPTASNIKSDVISKPPTTSTETPNEPKK